MNETEKRMSDGTGAAYGVVLQVMGPVIDVRFGKDELPAIYNALQIPVGDRVLTVADATLLMQFLVGYDVSFAGDADLNSDGRVTIYDAVCLLWMLNE